VRERLAYGKQVVAFLPHPEAFVTHRLIVQPPVIRPRHIADDEQSEKGLMGPCSSD